MTPPIVPKSTSKRVPYATKRGRWVSDHVVLDVLKRKIIVDEMTLFEDYYPKDDFTRSSHGSIR